MAEVIFYIFSAVIVVSALFVVSARNPITSAISLIVTLAGVAGLFVLQDGHFVATIQILVYAGAIMVLFVFVIMLLNLHPTELGTPHVTPGKVVGGLAALGSLALLVAGFSRVHGRYSSVGDDFGTLEKVGIELFTKNLIPFEVISVLLTAAVVGAVVVAKKEL